MSSNGKLSDFNRGKVPPTSSRGTSQPPASSSRPGGKPKQGDPSVQSEQRPPSTPPKTRPISSGASSPSPNGHRGSPNISSGKPIPQTPPRNGFSPFNSTPSSTTAKSSSAQYSGLRNKLPKEIIHPDSLINDPQSVTISQPTSKNSSDASWKPSHSSPDKSSSRTTQSTGSEEKQSPLNLHGSPTNLVITRKIKQTIPSDCLATCYAIKDGRQKLNSSSSKSLIKRSILKRLPGSDIGLITDLQKHVVVFTQADQKKPLPEKTQMGDFTLTKLMAVPMHEVVKTLHSGRSPTGSTDASLKILDILLDQWRPSKGHWDPKVRSLGLLQLRTLPLSDNGSKGQTRNLADVIDKYQKSNPGNLCGLDTYSKGLRIQVCERQNGESWNETRKPKLIVGLARLSDAQGSQRPRPPKVSKYGGGSKDVKFYTSPAAARDEVGRVSLGEIKAGFYTVAKYFEKRYKQALQRPDLPVVNVGTRTKPTYLPPAFCALPAEGQSKTLTLTLGNVADILGTTNTPRWIGNCDDRKEVRYPGLAMPIADRTSECTVGITGSSLLLPCRSRESPPLAFAKSHNIEATSGSWSMKSALLTMGKTPPRLSVVTIGADSWTSTREDFKKCLTDHGMNLNQDSMNHIPVPVNAVNFHKKASLQIHKRLLDAAKDKDMILIFLPTEKKLLYRYIKHHCDQVLGMQNVCIVAPKLANNQVRYFSQSILKMNLKSGGTNQKLKDVKTHAIEHDETMIVGIDTVMPPKKASEKAKGFIAMVASSNAAFSQWPAVSRLLDGKPMHQELADMVKSRVQVWKKFNKTGQLRSVIIYHNGPVNKDCVLGIDDFTKAVSEVLDREVKFTLVAVSKDHQAELEPLKPTDETANKSIIARTRTDKKTWDFVVQGYNASKQGNTDNRNSSAKQDKAAAGGSKAGERKAPHMLPTQYSVLHDAIFDDADARGQLENLTHDMCYLCGCSTSVVSSTLPIHYVSMLCKRLQIYAGKWYQPEPKTKPSAVRGDDSEAEESDGSEEEEMTQDSIEVKENLRDTMFYI